jgi:hypothetical protein
MSEYVDWSALGQILVTGLGVGVLVIVAYSVVVIGLDRRSTHRGHAGALAMVSVGSLICLAAFVGGILAMLDK